MYIYLVSFEQQVQVEGHIWPSLNNIPCTTSTYGTAHREGNDTFVRRLSVIRESSRLSVKVYRLSINGQL